MTTRLQPSKRLCIPFVLNNFVVSTAKDESLHKQAGIAKDGARWVPDGLEMHLPDGAYL